MELSTALTVSLILASCAVVVLVACVVPMAFQARRRLSDLALSAEQLKAGVEALVRDGGEMVRNVNALAVRANRPMDDVDHVARTLRKWTESADPLVGGVGAAIVAPVFSWLRTLDRYGSGAMTFFRALFRAKSHDNDPEQETVRRSG